MANALTDFTKKREFLVCMDSDGCVMNTVRIKHTTVMCPELIRVFALDEQADFITAAWDEINLHTITRAAQFEGIYADAQTAAGYWQTVADTINAACDAGTLPSRTGKRTATSQPIKAEYVPATLSETWNGLCHVAGLRGCAPYEALRSIGTEEDFAAWSGYLHCSFNSAAEAGKDTPYYSLYQKAVFAVMQGWARVYSILLTVGVVCALFFHLTELLPWIRKKCTAQTVVPWLLLFGIFGMALLRCAMIAFVEVSSFGIGTSTMYLATVHPLLALYAFVGLFLYGRPLKRKETA